LYHLSAIPSRLEPSKLAAHLRNLDSPWDGDVAAWLAQYEIKRKSEFDTPALGTVGAGNHFAEICRLERAVDPEMCQTLGLDDTHLYLMGWRLYLFISFRPLICQPTVHSGSRGLGASVLDAQTRTSANPYIAPDSPELPAYKIEHDYAVAWAVANRDLIAHRITQCLFPDGGNEATAPSNRALRKIVDITHNSVVLMKTRIATENDDGESAEEHQVWIHRKGAAPADRGVAPCPGSRGDFSWLLLPTGDGVKNGTFLSPPNLVPPPI
jgi:release factor H-coupled RctB family protein